MVAWLHLIPRLKLVHKSLAERLENIGAPGGGKVLFGAGDRGAECPAWGVRAKRAR